MTFDIFLLGVTTGFAVGIVVGMTMMKHGLSKLIREK